MMIDSWRLCRRRNMKLSARNQLKGTVKDVKLGQVMAEVVIDVAGQSITSIITKAAVQDLGLQKGAPCIVIIKATEVMVATP